MIKKLSKFAFSLMFLLLLVKPAFAQEKKVNIYFFWGDGCSHCAHEKPFLEKLEKKYPEVKVYDFETWGNSENRNLLIKVGEKLDTRRGFPMIFG